MEKDVKKDIIKKCNNKKIQEQVNIDEIEQNLKEAELRRLKEKEALEDEGLEWWQK